MLAFPSRAVTDEARLPTSVPFRDSDADGILDHHEKLTRTDPWDHDSDDDGYSDGTELAGRSNPRDAASIPAIRRGRASHADPPRRPHRR